MLNKIKFLTLSTLLTLTLSQAFAGVGLSSYALKNLASGKILSAAIDGGLGAASIAGGVRLVQRGRVGWGVFFLVLAEQNVISNDDVAALEGLDVSSKEAFLEIISSEESEETKQELLKALFE